MTRRRIRREKELKDEEKERRRKTRRRSKTDRRQPARPETGAMLSVANHPDSLTFGFGAAS